MSNTQLTEKFIQASGFRTRYLEGGSPAAMPVVLLHDGGYGGGAESSWAGVAPGLVSAGYRVIIPDMLGFGGTDKVYFFDRSPVAFRIKHIADFCADLGLSGTHFVGNSFGGTLIMRALALQELPWSFASACSIAGTGGPWRIPAAMAKISEFDGSEESMGRLVTFMCEPTAPGFDFEGYVKQRYARALAPGQYAALAAARLLPPWEEAKKPAPADAYPGSLENCRVPLLIVEATEDATCQSGWPAHIQQVLPTVSVEKISGRHCPNVDRPAVVCDLLARWFRRVESK